MQEQQAITIASGKPFSLAAAHASAACYITSHTKNLVLNKLPFMFSRAIHAAGNNCDYSKRKSDEFELLRGKGIRGHL